MVRSRVQDFVNNFRLSSACIVSIVPLEVSIHRRDVLHSRMRSDSHRSVGGRSRLLFCCEVVGRLSIQ